MAHPDHVRLLKKGPNAWNEWRKQNPGILNIDLRAANFAHSYLSGANLKHALLMEADLSGANLNDAYLPWANLTDSNLTEANLTGANLIEAILVRSNLSGAILKNSDLQNINLISAKITKANLSGSNLSSGFFTRANLSEVDLGNANLTNANFMEANLSGGNFSGANLSGVNLVGANLSGANLSGTLLYGASLVNTNLTNAKLNGCRVFGCSAWNLTITGAEQRDLVISRVNEPLITVDNLEVAQFIYLLLNNEKIHQVIDTITSKVVLILGRFTPERKVILDAIRKELRNFNYLPVVFDFDKPESRSITETVSTLAHMARFVIADITEPKSIPQELQRIIPDLPHLPVQPILLSGKLEYSMFEGFKHYPWVLPTFVYKDEAMILTSIKNKIIDPAEAKAKEQAMR